MKQWKSFYPALSSCSTEIVAILLQYTPATRFSCRSLFRSYNVISWFASGRLLPVCCSSFVVSICLTIINHSMCDNFCTVECYQQTTRRLMVCHYRTPAPPPFVTRFVSCALFMGFCYLAQVFSRSRNSVFFLLFKVFTYLCGLWIHSLQAVVIRFYIFRDLLYFCNAYSIIFRKWFICIYDGKFVLKRIESSSVVRNYWHLGHSDEANCRFRSPFVGQLRFIARLNIWSCQSVQITLKHLSKHNQVFIQSQNFRLRIIISYRNSPNYSNMAFNLVDHDTFSTWNQLN